MRNTASSEQKRKSQSSISARPPPTHAPRIFASNGLGKSSSAAVAILRVSLYWLSASPLLRFSPNCEMSAPAAKCSPSPVSTTRRIAGSSANSRNSFGKSRHISNESALRLVGLEITIQPIAPSLRATSWPIFAKSFIGRSCVRVVGQSRPQCSPSRKESRRYLGRAPVSRT